MMTITEQGMNGLREQNALREAGTPRFTVSGPVLKKALARVRPAMARSYVLPALSGVRFDVTPAEVTITATDLDLTITTGLEAEPFRGTGAFVAPYKGLCDAVKGAKKGDLVTVSADDLEVTVQLGARTVRIPALILGDWPRKVSEPIVTAGVAVLDMATLGDVASASGTDEARPILASVAMIGSDLVATDSYRLHLVRGAVDVGQESVLVPVKLCRVAVKHGGTALVGWSRTEVVVEFDDMTARERRFDGTFPNYGALIRKTSPGRVEFDRAALIAALTDLIPVSDKGTLPVRITTAGGIATLTVTSADVATATITLPCAVNGLADETTIAYNPVYLRELVSGGESATVGLDVVDGLKPAQVQEVLADGTERIRLVMPVRVS